MRTSLAISLLIVAAMLVGCQTQSWRGTSFEEGAGRGSASPWNVHSGLFEVSLGGGLGMGTIKDESFGVSDGGSGTGEGEPSSNSLVEFDHDVRAIHCLFFAGYMINDFWELGAFVEKSTEVIKPDEKFSSEDIDVTGWAIGPKIIYNFSNVGTDVVPFVAIAGGYGMMEYDDLLGVGDYDADRCFGQISGGVRIFGWHGFAINFEGYFRYVDDRVDDDVNGVIIDEAVRSTEIGGFLTFSLFF